MAGGNWTSTATWMGGFVPTALDTVVINSGTVVMDTRATISRLIMQSGQINAGERLLVTGDFVFYAGTLFGSDTIIVGGYANFLNSGTKKIGNKIVLQGGGMWSGGLLDFTVDPLLGGNNVATIDKGGTLLIENDTFKINNQSALNYKTNNPKGFYGSGKSLLFSFGGGLLQNLGVGLGFGGVDSFTVCRVNLENGGGSRNNMGHCYNGRKDEDETGIDCGGECGSCPEVEPNEDDTDDDADGNGWTSGLEAFNPGGYNAAQLGTTCNTNETAGEGGPMETINFGIFIDDGQKLVFNSSVLLSPTARVYGFGTLKINNSVLEVAVAGVDPNVVVRKIILNDGSVLKGNGKINSRTLHSLKSTTKSSVGLEVTRLALDNSFLVGTGQAVVDSMFILKGTTGNTLDRTIDVKWNSKWQCPDLSFAVNGKIIVQENATLNVRMNSTEMRFRNGRGPVIDNKGLTNFVSASIGKLVTPTHGSYFWNDGPNAVAKKKDPIIHGDDEIHGGGNSGGGGSDPADGDGEIEPGNGGNAGCDNSPQPPPNQGGCFKLAKGKIRVRKGAATYNSCFEQVTTGGFLVAETGNATIGSGASSTGLNIRNENGGTINVETCLDIKDIVMSGNNAVLNINAACSVNDVTLNAGQFGGNQDLEINGNLTINGGNLIGNRNITVHGITSVTTGSLANSGKSTHNNWFVWNGGSLGNGTNSDTIKVNGDMVIPSAFGKYLQKKALLLKGNVSWPYGNINVEYGGSIIIDTNATFTIENTPAADRNIWSSLTPSTMPTEVNRGVINNLSPSTIAINALLENHGQISNSSGVLYLSGTHNHYSGSSLSSLNGAKLYFSQGSNSAFKTHTFKSGSSLHVEASIELQSNAILKLENSVSFSGNPDFKSTYGTSLQSKIPNTFNNVDNSGEIKDTFDLSTLGNFSMNLGILSNLGDLNVGGKLFWQFGNLGGTTESGTIHVADSTFIFGGIKYLVKKTLHPHGHTKITVPTLSFFNNASLITDAGKTVDVIGSSNDFLNGDSNGGSFQNYGILRKMKTESSALTSSMNMAVVFTNFGTIAGNGAISFNQFTNAGTVSPGLSPGTLSMNKFSNANSVLQMELGYDQGMVFKKDSLAVTGTPAALGGTLDLSIIGGYRPDSGQIYKLITLPASYINTFATINKSGMPSDSFNWVIVYNATNVSLQYCPVWYPDTDGDGFGDFNGVGKFTACVVQPNGFVRSYNDCDPNDALEFPGQVWYSDADGDGYGKDDEHGCERVTNYFAIQELTGIGDCDDNNPNVHPNVLEICDGIDNNCDGQVDTMDAGLSLMVVENMGSGPGSLPYIMHHCFVNDSIHFGSDVAGETISLTDSLLIDGLLSNGGSYQELHFINDEVERVTLEFDQTNIQIPIRVKNPNVRARFKGVNFHFQNNVNKAAFFLELTSNKLTLDAADLISTHALESIGPGNIEVHGQVKARHP
ncbi:MAG: putative metal-binding motif-containing protein [Saprospiraceae bacterium]|nr:putative metal-binding motif-containing protein [Saprospiraceae bacterium]